MGVLVGDAIVRLRKEGDGSWVVRRGGLAIRVTLGECRFSSLCYEWSYYISKSGQE